MYDTDITKLNPDTLYSFFPKNKRLKLSKQGLNFISNSNMINNPQNKNFLIINGLSASNNKEMNRIKNTDLFTLLKILIPQIISGTITIITPIILILI